MKLTLDQQAQLLFKAQHEPRRNQKRFLKDLGGSGSAEELDEVLQMARDNPKAVAESERIDKARKIAARSVELGLDGHVAEMIAEIRLRIEDSGLTQSEVAARCGWPASLLSGYLTGQKLPGMENLAKLAHTLGFRWRMIPEKKSEKSG